MKVQRTDDYLPGDFSFLKNENIISLTFDYNIINNLKAWNILKKNKQIVNPHKEISGVFFIYPT